MVRFNTLILINSERIHRFVLNFIHYNLQINMFSNLTIYETNKHLEHNNDIWRYYIRSTWRKKTFNNQVIWSMVTSSRQVTFFHHLNSCVDIVMFPWTGEQRCSARIGPRSVKHYVKGDFFGFFKHIINNFVKSYFSCRIIFVCLVFQNSVLKAYRLFIQGCVINYRKGDAVFVWVVKK